MKATHWMALCLGVCLCMTASATKLGDPAPELSIKEWVKGDAVKIADGKDKKIFVVEFWATWCGPCRESIPHLTELQKKYAGKGVVFVGVSSEESAEITKFVKKMGDKMDYIIAVDDEEKTKKAYMDAFSAPGIPHAFVIDKAGNIAWHGHPMDSMESVLDKLVAGTFDIAAAEKLEKGKKLIRVYLYLVREVKEPDLAIPVGKRMMECIGPDKETLSELATLLTEEIPKDLVDRDMLAACADALKAAGDAENAQKVQDYINSLSSESASK